MKKIYTLFLLFIATHSYSQSSKIELYGGIGLFNTQLSRDSLIPPDRRGGSRLGDISMWGVQYNTPLQNIRWNIKAGIGFSKRHYSLNKYSIGDFFTAIFLFDSYPVRDSFDISYLRFTNNYLQVPLSVAYRLSSGKRGVQVTTGLQFRSDFLLSSKAAPRFDSAYRIPSTGDFERVKQTYQKNASKYMLTIEPFIDFNSNIYDRWGMYLQLRPVAFYTSKPDKKLTVYNAEFLGMSCGLFYSLR